MKQLKRQFFKYVDKVIFGHASKTNAYRTLKLSIVNKLLIFFPNLQYVYYGQGHEEKIRDSWGLGFF